MPRPGTLPVAPSPADIPRLTEPALRTTFALGTKIRDAHGDFVGFATELEHVLPDTDIATGRLHTRTLWTLILPGHGTDTTVADAKRERAARRNPFARIALFIRQVIGELKKVVTPTRKELFTFTGVVLVFVVIMMAIVWGRDQVCGWVVLYVFGQPGV
jgi:preprotein translocase subunit SecE